ncbi:MAG: hypothetical protein MRZ16_01275 [Parvimonas sp.]|uniref:hypothetical protein n=1 Tax=Parvimonas sp. TaxID=1944660 RepID=UPI0025CE0868|nr:hypothetical protein [Parvimonas sp.]MCI5996848.1 hypothetical protein [Parvimonas sp.]
MDYKKFLKKIKIYGDVEYKDYMKYLEELDMDEVKNLKYKYEYKTIKSNKFFDSILLGLTTTAILGIMYKIFNFISDVSNNIKHLGENLAQTLIIGSFVFGILICIIIFYLIYFLYSFVTNRSKKLAMINEFLDARAKKEGIK